jgi:hypothetical protein
VLGIALAAMVAAGLFQLLRPTTYVAVANVDIEPTVLSDDPDALAKLLEAEASYVTAPEVVLAVETILGPIWNDIRTVKSAPLDGRLRVAVSSYDPAAATTAAETIAREYVAFAKRRLEAAALSQHGVLRASIARLSADLVGINEGIEARAENPEAALANQAFSERALSDPAMAALLADRHVAVELLVEQQRKIGLLDGLQPAVMDEVESTQPSPANLGFARSGLLGVAIALVASLAVMAGEPLVRRVPGRIARRRDTADIDIRTRVIDLRDVPAPAPADGVERPLG